MVKDRFIAILLIISVMTFLVGGVCGDVHSDSHCVSDGEVSCASQAGDVDAPPAPDSDHPHDGHCDDCCSCTCHTCSPIGAITIKHAPLVAYLTPFEPFSAIPDVVIPKFVPPESLASITVA